MKNIALFLMQLTVGKQTRAKLSISESMLCQKHQVLKNRALISEYAESSADQDSGTTHYPAQVLRNTASLKPN